MADRQPRDLVELDTPAGLRRFAVEDTDVNGVLYERGLLAAPEPSRRLTDLGWGAIEIQDIACSLADPDGSLRAAYLADAPARLRKRKLVHKRWEVGGAAPTTRWSGLVSQPSLNVGRLDLAGSSLDLSKLEEQVPKGTVTTDLWPNAVDVGAVIPVAFGNIPRAKLLYINQDEATATYDYLCPRGTASLTALYTEGPNQALYLLPSTRTIKVPAVERKAFNSTGSGSIPLIIVGTDRCAIVTAEYAATGGVTASATLGGTAMTSLGATSHANGLIRVQWWFTLDPPMGTQNVVVTLSASRACVVTAVACLGVDQTMASGDFAYTAASGTSAAPSVTEASAPGQLVFDSVALLLLGTLVTATPNASGQADLTNLPQATTIQGLVSQRPGAASVAMPWTLLGARAWVSAAIRLKPAPLYTVSTGIYSGYTAVRFREPQLGPNNEPVTLRADVVGMQPERNAARAVRTFLSDTTWGLGQAVNTASFDAAETLLAPAASGLSCDGLMAETRQAQDWLADLCMFGSMRLGINESSEWTVTVDQPRAGADAFIVGESEVGGDAEVGGGSTFTPDLIVADAADEGPKNLLARSRRRPPRLEDSIARLILRYRWYEPTSDFLFSASRSVSSVGKERTLTNRFVQDHGTADRLADVIAKREAARDDTVDVEITQEAAGLLEGMLVQIFDPPLGFTGELYELAEVGGPITRIEALAQGYDPNAWVYEPVTLPTDPLLGTALDFSKTPPGPVVNLAVAGGGTEIGPDGTSLAYALIRFDPPALNYAEARVQIRPNGAGPTEWEDAGSTKATGTAVQVRISALVPGQKYDLRVKTVNAWALESLTYAALYGITASVVGLPAAPSGMTVTQAEGFGRANLIRVTGLPSLPFDEARVYRNSTNSFAGSTLVCRGKSLAFVDITPSIGTWHYWASFVSGGVESAHTA